MYTNCGVAQSGFVLAQEQVNGSAGSQCLDRRTFLRCQFHRAFGLLQAGTSNHELVNTGTRSTLHDVVEVVFMDILVMVDAMIDRVCKVYTDLETV